MLFNFLIAFNSQRPFSLSLYGQSKDDLGEGSRRERKGGQAETDTISSRDPVDRRGEASVSFFPVFVSVVLSHHKNVSYLM